MQRDCDFNDQVPFKLTVTLPSNFDDYQTYNLEFVDTLSKGLKYNEDAKVYLENEGKIESKSQTNLKLIKTLMNFKSLLKICNLLKIRKSILKLKWL